jgi:hypothetical protein
MVKIRSAVALLASNFGVVCLGYRTRLIGLACTLGSRSFRPEFKGRCWEGQKAAI